MTDSFWTSSIFHWQFWVPNNTSEHIVLWYHNYQLS